MGRALAVRRSLPSIAALVALVALLAGVATPGGAQRRPGAPGTQVEARVDLLAASATTVHGGAGVLWRAGRYVQAGLLVGAGTTRRDLGADERSAGADETVASGRAELVARFVVDPLADPFTPAVVERRWLLYGGAGGGVLVSRGGSPLTRVFVSLGVSAPPRAGWRPALELGLGGGTRVGIALQRD